jgi:hypothetical protein
MKTVWILVLIAFIDGDVISMADGVFPTMNDCFWARETAASEVFGGDDFGYYPLGTQGICVQVDAKYLQQ